MGYKQQKLFSQRTYIGIQIAIFFVLPKNIRTFAPRNQQKEGNYAETIDDDRADDLVCRYG